jgi:hypothetical protein
MNELLTPAHPGSSHRHLISCITLAKSTRRVELFGIASDTSRQSHRVHSAEKSKLTGPLFGTSGLATDDGGEGPISADMTAFAPKTAGRDFGPAWLCAS